MSRTGNRRFQQRTLYSHLHRISCLILALTGTNTDMSNSFILHDSLNVSKIQIDNCRQIDQVCNPLYRLLQHFIRFLKGIGHRRPSVHDFKQLIIWDHNECIHVFFQTLNTAYGIDHPRLCLKTKGLCHNTYCQNTHFLRDLGHYRSRSCTSAPSHTACYEYHVSTSQGICDFIYIFFCCFLSDLRFCAGTQTLCQLLSDLQQFRSLTKLQRLLVRIDTDKFHTINTFIDHSIYSVITCTSNANYNDFGCRFRVVRLYF